MTAALTPRQRMQERAKARLAICQACPALKGKRPLERCMECGCMMRAKVLIAAHTCPKGKW